MACTVVFVTKWHTCDNGDAILAHFGAVWNARCDAVICRGGEAGAGDLADFGISRKAPQVQENARFLNFLVAQNAVSPQYLRSLPGTRRGTRPARMGGRVV